MSVSPKIKCCTILLFLVCTASRGWTQSGTSLNDTMCLKYMFWSSPRYSIPCGANFTVSHNRLTALSKPEFNQHFSIDFEEYEYLKMANRKFVIGNYLCAIPAGILYGLALFGNYDRDTRNVFFITGTAFVAIDITLGISGFKDMKVAVRLRNNRIRSKYYY